MGRKFRICLAFVVATTLVFQGCRSQNSVQSVKLDSLITHQAGDQAILEYNSSKTYVLVKEKVDSASYLHGPLDFAVYRLNDNALITEGTFSRGYARWISDTVIEIQSIPEKVKVEANLDVYKRRIYIEGSNH